MTRTYRAASITEAIRLAKEELGPDALIVDVRRVANLPTDDGRQGAVEITALSPDAAALVDDALPPLAGGGDDVALPRRRARRGPGGPRGGTSPVGRRFQPGDGASPRLDVHSLRQAGVSGLLAERLLEACFASAPSVRRAAVARVLEAAVPTRPLAIPPGGRIVAALVGPSGAGKTTTIAKLAALYSRAQGKKVALVTGDTYRVGGIAQLRTFASILDLPFFTAYTREDLVEALRAASDAEVVLVDTPGCNPYDASMLKEMRQFLGQRDPIDCFLTVALTTDFSDLLQIGQRFGLLNPTGLIVTKVDETSRSAALVGLAQRLNLPLSYLCTGPQVPEDIGAATPILLADLFLRGLEYFHS